MKTNSEIVRDANNLARLFYQSMGCDVSIDYKFYEATHPQEKGCWNLAIIAYDFIEGTDVEDCLDEFLAEE